VDGGRRTAATSGRRGWISSRGAGNFDLTLRLYVPDPALLANPGKTVAAPRIERLECGA